MRQLRSSIALATTSVKAEAPDSNWDYEGPYQDGVEQHKEAIKHVAIVLEEPPAREAQPTVIKGMDAMKNDLDGQGFLERKQEN